MSLIRTGDSTDEAETIEFRTLNESNAATFREIRLEALRVNGQYFTADRGEEEARTDSEWALCCAEICNHAIFGAFVGGKLIGVMEVTKWEDDASGKTVRWGSSYVQESFRGKGFGEILYKNREQWSRQHEFVCAVFTIRHDNLRSTKIHRENGAEPVRSEVKRFADGSEALTWWYRKEL